MLVSGPLIVFFTIDSFSISAIGLNVFADISAVIIRLFYFIAEILSNILSFMYFFHIENSKIYN